MRIDRCNNIGDFRSMARRRLPGPIFHYIDGAADDEVTYRRNTEAYERCDLVPNVLAGVESIDMSITVMGQKIDMPLFCAPTALQRLFHHDGERAVAKAAEKFGTMFGISSLGTISIEEIGSTISTPKLFQLYFHKDRGLTNSMIERCIAANFDVLALTVDTITGGNRERDLRTGFTSPPRLRSCWNVALLFGKDYASFATSCRAFSLGPPTLCRHAWCASSKIWLGTGAGSTSAFRVCRTRSKLSRAWTQVVNG